MSLSDLIAKIFKAIADWIDRCLPVFNPAAWNDGNGIQLHNNCYNYGCDMQTGTYAQPGRAHGITLGPNNANCTDVTNAAKADGLVPVNCDEGCGCKECQHQVALVIKPWNGISWDYHWYRKDRNGMWSHKMGGTPATSLDNSWNPISDPRTANRGAYTVFCGCFCVNKQKVTIN